LDERLTADEGRNMDIVGKGEQINLNDDKEKSKTQCFGSPKKGKEKKTAKAESAT